LVGKNEKDNASNNISTDDEYPQTPRNEGKERAVSEGGSVDFKFDEGNQEGSIKNGRRCVSRLDRLDLVLSTFSTVLLVITSITNKGSVILMSCSLVMISLHTLTVWQQHKNDTKHTPSIVERVMDISALLFVFVALVLAEINGGMQLSPAGFALISNCCVLTIVVCFQAWYRLMAKQTMQRPPSYLSREALLKMLKPYYWPGGKSNRLAYINRK